MSPRSLDASLGVYLEGQGDLVSILITPISHIVSPIIPIGFRVLGFRACPTCEHVRQECMKSGNVTHFWVQIAIRMPTNGRALGGPPHSVIVTIRHDKDYLRVLSYSYDTTIAGWGVLLTHPNPYLHPNLTPYKR